jgi:hypothetical protein
MQLQRRFDLIDQKGDERRPDADAPNLSAN